jgi:hypothetical protein
MKKYIVRLTDEERVTLENLVSKGKAAAYRIKHANILLQVDIAGPSWSDEKTAKAFRCHTNTVRNVRQRLVEQGLKAALERKKQDRPSREQIIDGDAEAHLIKIACGQAPEGRAKWTMALLANKLIELEIVESVSGETIRRTLKKTNSNHIFASVG